MPAALSHWDELEATEPGPGALVLSFFTDERPLHGAAGLADWRLYGQLSRLILAGRCDGASGESLMMPAGPRLPFERIFLFGLGSGTRLNDEAFSKHASVMRSALRRAGSKNYSVQAPGRATGLIAARRAAELWLEQADDSDERVTLIDSPGGYKEMGDMLLGSSEDA